MSKNSPALFEMSARPTGRHEKMLLAAVDEARAAGRLEVVDDGLVSLAIANARALDEAEASPKPYYPVAQITGPYREVLQSLRMTPDARESEANDELARALADLSTATVRDA